MYPPPGFPYPPQIPGNFSGNGRFPPYLPSRGSRRPVQPRRGYLLETPPPGPHPPLTLPLQRHTGQATAPRRCLPLGLPRARSRGILQRLTASGTRGNHPRAAIARMATVIMKCMLLLVLPLCVAGPRNGRRLHKQRRPPERPDRKDNRKGPEPALAVLPSTRTSATKARALQPVPFTPTATPAHAARAARNCLPE